MDEWAAKIAHIIGRGWPFLVAERENVVVAYAYATQFRDRPAYARTCETSIYVAQASAGQGIGTTLLTALKTAAAEAGFQEMIAVISGGDASIALHSRCGFAERGRLAGVGCKFGRRLDTVYMQHSLS